ncbi:MAG: ABC transporter ATP-binding protein, partial [Streptococcus sp.]|nr:ABC transporter ATP-binding protein [Streptococcus sp.]
EQDLTTVEMMHSMEPTLEEIFIQLTGEKLND